MNGVFVGDGNAKAKLRGIFGLWDGGFWNKRDGWGIKAAPNFHICCLKVCPDVLHNIHLGDPII
eukprot:11405150-Ditylum_brightwellii.AAC.1